MNPSSPVRKILFAWLPVALWMTLLFGASTEMGTPRRTSRILIPLLRWLVPDISPAALNRAQLAVRKTGHAVGYAVLATLIWWARRRTRPEGEPPCFRRDATFAFALTVLYAATDEWHQTFTTSRQGSLADVALDASGAAAGLALLWLWDRWRGQRKPAEVMAPRI